MSLEEGDINGGSRPTPGEWGVAIARDSAGGAHGCTAHAGDGTQEGEDPLPTPTLSPADNFATSSVPSKKHLKYPFKSCLQSVFADTFSVVSEGIYLSLDVSR